tara:strand:+ start:262 stop:459 length:198 start_codon:yes stop_codon:yes gene_type:complete
MKFEKITLWTCTETYGDDSRVGALDYIVDTLEGLEAECKLLGYEAEDYKLVPNIEERLRVTRKEV